MAQRRPIAIINGRASEIPVGDTIATDLAPVPGDAGTFDGGTAATTFTGVPRIDAGGAS
jgi:hypothetical protein